jgi:hypothetical protein
MKRVVITLHGIESRGEWQKQATPILAQEGWVPVPLDYGNFSTIKFLMPPARSRKLAWFVGQYEAVRNALTGGGVERPSIIAHSFGSYIVAKALEKYHWIKFDKVLFCGSIVRPNYPWAEIFKRHQVNCVRNEYGSLDFWAGVVGYGVFDAGPSGKRGFIGNDPDVDNHHFPYSHSEYFLPGHYRQNWIPYLRKLAIAGRERDEAKFLLEQAAGCFSNHLGVSPDRVRVSVMGPENQVLKIVPGLTHNIFDPIDLGVHFPFGAGAVGQAFKTQQPTVFDPGLLPSSQRSQMNKDVTWGLSMPIPDVDNPSGVIGVLNVEGIIDVRPKTQVSDPAILADMVNYARTLFGMFSFPKQ